MSEKSNDGYESPAVEQVDTEDYPAEVVAGGDGSSQ